eukprot:811185-Rhodomonas_salina.2
MLLPVAAIHSLSLFSSDIALPPAPHQPSSSSSSFSFAPAAPSSSRPPPLSARLPAIGPDLVHPTPVLCAVCSPAQTSNTSPLHNRGGASGGGGEREREMRSQVHSTTMSVQFVPGKPFCLECHCVLGGCPLSQSSVLSLPCEATLALCDMIHCDLRCVRIELCDRSALTADV